MYQWNFGDVTSSQMGPTVTKTYSSPGVYTISLDLNDSPNTVWWASDEITITVAGGCDIQMVTTAQNQNNGVVSFMAASVGGTQPNTYLWSFSDGQTSTIPNPTLTFANGFYTACLTTYNGFACTDSTCMTFNVTNGACPQDLIDIETTVNGNTVTGMVSTNTFVALPLNIVIDYGDGSAPFSTFLTSVFTFQHTYTGSDSLFSICVSATDQAQCFDTECETISLNPCNALQAVYTHSQISDGNVLFSANSNR
jgi:PKD repeat protein